MVQSVRTPLCFSLAALLLLVACGGSTQPPPQDTRDGGGEDGARQTPPDSPDGASCVDIEVTSADLTCSTDDDCVRATIGVICSASCCPGGAPVNKAAAARIASEIEGAHFPPPMGCPGGCGAFGAEHCVEGVCTICPFGPSQTPECPDGG